MTPRAADPHIVNHPGPKGPGMVFVMQPETGPGIDFDTRFRIEYIFVRTLSLLTAGRERFQFCSVEK